MVQDDDAIISLEAWRVARTQPSRKCQHERYVINERAGVVECRDCEAVVSAFHVLVQCAREENRLYERYRSLKAEIAELKAWTPFLKAMRHLERLWRGKKMLPCCPHCRRGIWAEELTGSAVGVRHEITQRRTKGIALPAGVDPRDGLQIAPTPPAGPEESGLAAQAVQGAGHTNGTNPKETANA